MLIAKAERLSLGDEGSSGCCGSAKPFKNDKPCKTLIREGASGPISLPLWLEKGTVRCPLAEERTFCNGKREPDLQIPSAARITFKTIKTKSRLTNI
jgi:hypothetical protein